MALKSPNSVQDLRDMTDAELVQKFDEQNGGRALGLDFILRELNFRERERQTRKMVRLTWAISFLTLVVTIATVVNVWIQVAPGS